MAQQSLTNKQGRGNEVDEDTAKEILKILKEDSARCYENYTWMLNEKNSIYVKLQLVYALMGVSYNFI